VIILVGVLAPITFSREIEGSKSDLIVPEEFIKDFHFFGDENLMIMLRVIGTDTKKVRDFFQDSETHIIRISTIESIHKKKIAQEFILTSVYMDEGPPISVDIDSEPPMIRTILDFQMK
jgi:hypothetical protein